MAGNGLEELEAEAARRRRREPGAPRNPRTRTTAEERRQEAEERRREELEQRERERREREQREEERLRAEEEAARQAAEAESEPPEREAEASSEAEQDRSSQPQRGRTPSIPFYYDPENEAFLWEIQQEAVSRRVKVPASAVLRLAMRRLQDQMPPARIVQELSGPPETTGKRGRPRR